VSGRRRSELGLASPRCGRGFATLSRADHAAQHEACEALLGRAVLRDGVDEDERHDHGQRDGDGGKPEALAELHSSSLAAKR
jgi:hypothetical protein